MEEVFDFLGGVDNMFRIIGIIVVVVIVFTIITRMI